MSISSFEPPTVALILHYRDAAPTIRCLQSLLQENIRNIIVVDNSEDAGESWQTVNNYLITHETQQPSIDLITPKANLGFAAGVNMGLGRAQILYKKSPVLLLNNDARLYAGAHQALRGELRNDSTAVEPWLHKDNGVPLLAKHYYHRWLALYYNKLPGTFLYPSCCCLLLGSMLCTPKLLDEAFFFYGEDVALGWHFLRNHIPLIFTEKARVLHEGSGSSQNGSLFYEYHMNRGHLLLTSKLARNWPELLLMMFARMFTLPARAAVRSLRFRSMRPWLGLWLASMDVALKRTRKLTPKTG